MVGGLFFIGIPGISTNFGVYTECVFLQEMWGTPNIVVETTMFGVPHISCKNTHSAYTPMLVEIPGIPLKNMPSTTVLYLPRGSNDAF